MGIHLTLGFLQASASLFHLFGGGVGATFEFADVSAGIGQFGLQLPKLAVDRTLFHARQVWQGLSAERFGGMQGLLGLAERTFQGFDLFSGRLKGLSLLEFGAAHGQLDLGPFQIGIFYWCNGGRGRSRGGASKGKSGSPIAATALAKGV